MLPRNLDSEARKRLIFNNDIELYTRAKAASDGFEHGFLPFQTIREHAVATRDGCALALRKTILTFAGLSAEDIAVLLAPPFDKIPTLRVDKYLFGTLRGPLAALAPENETYPILGWSSKVKGLVVGDDGTTTIEFNETITPRLGSGTTFSAKRFELWGGAGGVPPMVPDGGA